MFNPILFIFLLLFMTDLLAQVSDEILTDPTRPGVVSSSRNISETQGNEELVYNLSQIYISKKRQMAIINNQQVSVGDTVDGAKVLSIKSGKVQLLIDANIMQFTLIPAIKQYKN